MQANVSNFYMSVFLFFHRHLFFYIYNPQNEKMWVSETKGLKNPQIPKTKRLLFIQTHKRQRKPKQPVSLPFVLYIQFKSNIIFTANQTDSLINVILVNMDITKV